MSRIGPIRPSHRTRRSQLTASTALRGCYPKTDRSALSRELAPTGPFGFWLEKIFGWLLFFIESRSRQTFDPHWVRYLGNRLVSVGFRFRLNRSSRTYLAGVMPRGFFVAAPTRFLRISRGKISVKKFLCP